MTDFLLGIGLLYIMIKIPSWMLRAVRGPGGRSLLGGLVRAFIAYKTLGFLGSRFGGRAAGAAARAGGGGRRPGRGGPRPSGAGSSPSGGGPSAGAGGSATRTRPYGSRGNRWWHARDPYHQVQATPGGQYMLPLGVTPGRAPRRPGPPPGSTRQQPARPRTPRGRQPSLFTPTGQPTAAAKPPDLGPGAFRTHTQPGQQTMLPIYAHPAPAQGSGQQPPTTGATNPTGTGTRTGTQPGLFTRTGKPNPAARPPKPGNPGAVPGHVPPGGQYPLPLVGPFTTGSSPRPATSSSTVGQSVPPPQAPVRGQQSLFTRQGQVNPRAKPPRRRRGNPPDPADPPGGTTAG